MPEPTTLTLYIAGPMTGLPEFNYPAFNAAEERLQAAEFGTLNSARHGFIDGHTWADYMRLGLTDVCAADGIAVLDGWINSKGARWEVQTAQRLGIPIKTVAEWIDHAECPPDDLALRNAVCPNCFTKLPTSNICGSC